MRKTIKREARNRRSARSTRIMKIWIPAIKPAIEPLQKYLDAVDRAASFSELNAAIAQSVLELGNFANGLIPGIPVTDTKDSSRKVLQLMTQVPGLDQRGL